MLRVFKITVVLITAVLITVFAAAHTAFAESADMKNLRAAAEDGDSFAQFKLGEMYWNGVGAKKNPAAAVRGWRKAAKGGDVVAQYWMGRA